MKNQISCIYVTDNHYFCKKQKMSEENPTQQEFSKEDMQEYKKNPFRQYGIYSSIVFQMLAIIALGFWGGKKLNDYFGIGNNLLTVGIGFLGLGLALYNTLKQLENLNKEK